MEKYSNFKKILIQCFVFILSEILSTLDKNFMENDTIFEPKFFSSILYFLSR